MSKEISKFLSYVLRHAPEAIGLSLDANGWADVDELLAKAKSAGKRIDLATLQAIVAENDKKRFTLSDDGRRIRAAQGHSVAVDLGLEPSEPPPVLYHGTATRNLDAIRAEGLKPGSRQQVHLSLDPATARKVGERHGKPAVLTVDAAATATASSAPTTASGSPIACRRGTCRARPARAAIAAPPLALAHSARAVGRRPSPENSATVMRRGAGIVVRTAWSVGVTTPGPARAPRPKRSGRVASD